MMGTKLEAVYTVHPDEIARLYHVEPGDRTYLLFVWSFDSAPGALGVKASPDGYSVQVHRTLTP